MPLAYDTNNYLIGKGRLYFKKNGANGFLDLGNVPKFEITPAIESSDHFTSRSGTKKKDLTLITEKKATAEFDLEEYSSENLNLAFLGDSVVAGSQSAGTIDAEEKTVFEKEFIDLEKIDVFSVKIAHGSVTGGPFEIGETITGGTSSATGKVAWINSNFIEIVNVSGTFEVGETITGGTSSASATSSTITVQEDVVVTDDATTPTTRYEAGVDYSIDVDGGLFRKNPNSSIGTTCVISADYSAKTLASINALQSSIIEGQLRFVGDPDQGPKYKIDCWKVNLKINGPAAYISDEIVSIAMTADILADETSHPLNPFFQATEIS